MYFFTCRIITFSENSVVHLLLSFGFCVIRLSAELKIQKQCWSNIEEITHLPKSWLNDHELNYYYHYYKQNTIIIIVLLF